MFVMDQGGRRDEEAMTQKRAQVLRLSYVDTSQLQKQLYKTVLPVAELYSLKVVPLIADDHNIHFGITTTTPQQTVTGLRARFTDYILRFSLISDAGYNEYMHLYDPPKQVEYHDIKIAETERQNIIGTVSKTLEEVRPDDMLAYLVQQAYKLKASDIHLETQRENVRIRFRIDGVLHPIAYIGHEKYRHLIAAIASAADVSTNADDAQQGHISQQYKLATGEDVTLNLRVETVPTVYGMDIVMRLFNLKLELFKLDNLSLSPPEMAVVQDIIKRPTGLVIVVGPTGSGKTTTLYSILNSLNTPERKIITLEDPVEYNMPGIVQIPVRGSLESESFAEKLRAVLRLDPDIVMVGEIRDKDTAKTALQGALTGHLVLSTFHAGSAAAALSRMLDMVGINPLFASAIRLVMAQRLVRRLDENTKQPYHPDEALKRQLQQVIDGLPPQVQKPDLSIVTLYKAGSSAGNPFGYTGQLPIREQLLMTAGVAQLLRRPPNEITPEMLEAQAVKEGMQTMLQDGVLKAIQGLTTIEEVYRVVA
jgi:type II secretory ATPase GspE/PulE/Tfp pilus assembly ATPase PilB-like protein